MWQGSYGGGDVKCLQAVLNLSPDTRVAETGPGSPGQETLDFGPSTTAAVVKFQSKYSVDLITGTNIGIGMVRAATRGVLNEILKGLR